MSEHGVDTWETQDTNCLQSTCLKEGCWTRVPRLQEWPETQNCYSLQTKDFRTLQTNSPVTTWVAGQAVTYMDMF